MIPVISVKELSKKYRFGQALPYYSLRDEISSFFIGQKKHSTDEFWAIKNLTFDIFPGQVVGLIGRNGAGKSTLLKILSRITPPSSGQATIFGRVASLLEVGTGFHPELTGLENVFINGAILGMTRSEIKSKLDEIMAFADIAKFMDTPVKHYSSGMLTRLAFSIAAHLEAEILLIDEVLAVGDFAFQKKCLAKMESISHSGRTIIFVSHNMAAVSGLCQRGLLLESGRLIADDRIDRVVGKYLRQVDAKKGSVFSRASAEGTQELVVTSVQILDSSSQKTLTIPAGSPVTFEMDYRLRRPVGSVDVAIGIDNENGTRVATLWTKFSSSSPVPVLSRQGKFSCHIPNLNLRPGHYWLTLYVESQNKILYHIRQATSFVVSQSEFFINYPNSTQGDVLFPHTWS